MENKAILVEWGHLIKGFNSRTAEFRLDVVGTGETLKVSEEVSNSLRVLVKIHLPSTCRMAGSEGGWWKGVLADNFRNPEVRLRAGIEGMKKYKGKWEM